MYNIDLSDIEIQQARAFLAVAREGSVGRAADRIGRTQPSVTMSIQKLERDVKTDLIERSGRGVRLTAAGQRLAQYLGPLLEQWDAARTHLDDSPDGVLRGPVRVGGGEAAILYLLPAALAAFRREHPEADLVVRHEPAEETLAGLRDGSLDFGIRSLPTPPGDIEFRPILTCDRVLIAKRGSAVLKGRPSLAKLAREPFVLPRKGSTTRTMIEGAFAQAGLALRVAVEAGGWEIVKRYAAMGLGISVIPDFCIRPVDRKALSARSLRPVFGQEIYGILSRRGREPSKGGRALIELLVAER
jgi:DNA-binding transcriptional LysR family regulator